MKLAVFAAERQETPAGKKKLLRFYSFNDRFKLHYFLSICQLSAAGERRKKLRYLFLCKPILSMSVLIAVRVHCCLRCYLPEWIYRYYVFSLLALKTTWFWWKTSSFSNLNHYPVACTNRVGQQTSIVCFTRCKNASDADINACTLSGKHMLVL